MASVAFEGLGKTYPNGHRALSDFTLGIGDGELIVFVGPSGCGKSTLLRLLAGLERPTEGSLLIDGRIVNDWTPQARNVAMVFQDYALYPTMTVRENLAFPLRMRKLSRTEIERRIRWAAELLSLGDVLDRLPKLLSGGQRQRVAMGRALVREPTVFLLDEPLSNLDAQLRTQVRAEIVDLQRRTGRTMIYVTHDQVEAMTMGERIAVLSGGRLQQAGVPQSLYEAPANTFVAGFIGTPPMNLIPMDLLQKVSASAATSGDPAGINGLLLEEGEALCCTIGVRPEHVSVATDPLSPGLPARIIQTEYLGHETLVHFTFDDAKGCAAPGAAFVARMSGLPKLDPQTAVRIRFHPNHLHGFDHAGDR
jgi:ABC-type sugar transport system ATPase subunit